MSASHSVTRLSPCYNYPRCLRLQIRTNMTPAPLRVFMSPLYSAFLDVNRPTRNEDDYCPTPPLMSPCHSLLACHRSTRFQDVTAPLRPRRHRATPPPMSPRHFVQNVTAPIRPRCHCATPSMMSSHHYVQDVAAPLRPRRHRVCVCVRVCMRAYVRYKPLLVHFGKML